MIFDLHNDFPTALSQSEYGAYVESLGDGVTVTGAIWTSEFGDNAAERVSEIMRALKKQAPSSPVAIEDIGFLCDNDAYEDFDFSDLLYCTLTWNYDNGFAGGALGDGELTERGRRAIDRINGSDCAVDVAHLNKKSFYAVTERARRVVCSHTGFNAHARSLDDRQIRALIERNAVIGLCTVRAFTDATCYDGFVEVIDRFVQKFGADCLAIGTDFYGSTDIPDDVSEYSHLTRLKESLMRLGYTRDDADKIMYKNALSFYDTER